MSRCVNLEFGDESARQQPVMGNAIKDEAFYVREARLAFENADFEPALRSYAKVLEHNPQNASGWTGQVRALVEPWL